MRVPDDSPQVGFQCISVVAGDLDWGCNGVLHRAAAKDAFLGYTTSQSLEMMQAQRGSSDAGASLEQRGSVPEEGRDGERGNQAVRRVVGRFFELRGLRHPNLTTYLAVVHTCHDLLTVISTHPGRALSGFLAEAFKCGRNSVERGVCSPAGALLLARDVGQALAFLHEHGVAHRGISPACILLTPALEHGGEQGNVTVFGRAVVTEYGNFSLTGEGEDTMLPLADPRFSAPEVLLGPLLAARGTIGEQSDGFFPPELTIAHVLARPPSPHRFVTVASTAASDLFSLGAVLLCVLLQCPSPPWAAEDPAARRQADWSQDEGRGADAALGLLLACGLLPECDGDRARHGPAWVSRVLHRGGWEVGGVWGNPGPQWEGDDAGTWNLASALPPREAAEAEHVLHSLLEIEPSARSTARELLQNPAVACAGQAAARLGGGAGSLHGEWHEWPCSEGEQWDAWEEEEAARLLVDLWLQTGPDWTAMEAHCLPLRRQPCRTAETCCSDSSSPAELFLPPLPRVLSPLGMEGGRSVALGVPLRRLEHSLGGLPPGDEAGQFGASGSVLGLGAQDQAEGAVLPGREWVIGQRVSGMALCRLLRAGSALPWGASQVRVRWREQVLEGARQAGSVPPSLRARVWAVVLGVDGREAVHRHAYRAARAKGCGSEVVGQIAKDVRRSHAHAAEVGTAARASLSRVLEAWAAAHPQRVYLQGLDALAMPLVLLAGAGEDGEARAWAMLSALVEQRLGELFAESAAQHEALHQRLGVLTRLLALHDPPLLLHLRSLGVSPDLFAIPWLLTWLAHSLPLPTVFPLWDRLLLGPPQLPVAVAAAVVVRCRTPLLAASSMDQLLAVLLGNSPGSWPLIADGPRGALRLAADAEALLGRTPASVTACNALGLHLAEATLAELAPRLSSAECGSAAARGSLCIVAVAPVDAGAERCPGTFGSLLAVRVGGQLSGCMLLEVRLDFGNSRLGVRGANEAQIPSGTELQIDESVVRGLDAARGWLVGVVGLGEGLGERGARVVAAALMERMGQPLVCVLTAEDFVALGGEVHVKEARGESKGHKGSEGKDYKGSGDDMKGPAPVRLGLRALESRADVSYGVNATADTSQGSEMPCSGHLRGTMQGKERMDQVSDQETCAETTRGSAQKCASVLAPLRRGQNKSVGIRQISTYPSGMSSWDFGSDESCDIGSGDLPHQTNASFSSSTSRKARDANPEIHAMEEQEERSSASSQFFTVAPTAGDGSDHEEGVAVNETIEDLSKSSRSEVEEMPECVIPARDPLPRSVGAPNSYSSKSNSQMPAGSEPRTENARIESPGTVAREEIEKENAEVGKLARGGGMLARTGGLLSAFSQSGASLGRRILDSLPDD